MRVTLHCLIDATVRPVKQYDLVSIPGLTWHQFRATRGTPLGFLCMVNAERDKPQLPSAQEMAAMAADPRLAAFFKGAPIE
ncbi:MAG: Cupin 2 conserved barrel domain protein [Gammaproteobacteria bacterium]|nr:Cupin 2 conserved barrel domain protein [Gammaproteobacteria bacterium]